MPLTHKQQEFLDKYVSKWKYFSKRKSERASNFSKIRQNLQDTLSQLPTATWLELYPEIFNEIDKADKIGEKLKFNSASREVDKIINRARLMIFEHSPKNPEMSEPVNLEQVESLSERLATHEDIAKNKIPTNSEDLDHINRLSTKANNILQQNVITKKDFAEAKILLKSIESRVEFSQRRANEIDKLKHRLERDAKSLMDNAEGKVKKKLLRAIDLTKTPTNLWSEKLRNEGMSIYLDMTMLLAERDDVDHKDLKPPVVVNKKNKKNSNPEPKEIVLAVRRKYASLDKDVPEKLGNSPNFKMVVKPTSREISVSGFSKGGGGIREEIASKISNKIQQMTGIVLGVPETHLTQVDGQNFGLDSKEEYASVQMFQGGSKISDRLLTETDPLSKDHDGFINNKIDPKDVQAVAIFDLITLHADRHAGNLLISDDNKIIPIDHGNILPTRESMSMLAERRHDAHTLGHSDAYNQKLDEDLLAAVNNIDIKELEKTLRESTKHPSLSKEAALDLEEGINNSIRSTEFLKYAAPFLTVKQISFATAYLHIHVFEPPEDKKFDGFKRAIEILLSREQSIKALNERFPDLITENPLGFNYDQWKSFIAPKLVQLGWLASAADTTAPQRDLAENTLLAVKEILENNIKAPSLGNNSIEKPKDLISKEVPVDLWNRFCALGGFKRLKDFNMLPSLSTPKPYSHYVLRTLVGSLDLIFLSSYGGH